MSVIPFNYYDQPVRVVEINGEPWFVGTDVARVLGYANPSDALGRLATLALSEGSRIVTRERPIVSESGVYALVFSSSLPDARAFRRWVTTVRITAKGAVALAVMLNVAPADLAEALTTLDEEATA